MSNDSENRKFHDKSPWIAATQQSDTLLLRVKCRQKGVHNTKSIGPDSTAKLLPQHWCCIYNKILLQFRQSGLPAFWMHWTWWKRVGALPCMRKACRGKGEMWCPVESDKARLDTFFCQHKKGKTCRCLCAESVHTHSSSKQACPHKSRS